MTNNIPPARVLFFAPFGTYTVHHQLDAVVAAALRARGAEVAAIRCDGVLTTCDQFALGEDRAQTCGNCQWCGNSLFAAFGVPSIQMRAALSESDHGIAEEWAKKLDPSEYTAASFQGIPIGEWVTSSLFSYYRITPSGLDNREVRALTAETHRQLLVSGLLTYWAMVRIINQVKPSHIICFNARIAAYRVAFEAAKASGVEVITHERGYRDDTFTVFSNFGSIQTQPIYDAYSVWKDVPLNRGELQRVRQYFENRERGTDSNFEPFIDFATDYGSVRSALRVPADARLIGVFTSSEYEFALCRDYDAFIDQLDLIERLMVVFRERPNDYLIVRHHPYLGGNASSLADHGFIEKAIELARLAPRNVRFVMPGERLNSYALINNLDGAIAPLTTAGVELIARGVATACFEQSAYRDALTESISDDGRRYLHALIDRLIARTADFGTEDLRRLYRFQNTMISKVSNQFETFGIRDIYAPSIKTEKLALVATGGDEALDRVCDHILKGTPILPQPSRERKFASTEEEDVLLSESLDMIRSLRRRVKEEAKRCKATLSDCEVAVVTFGDLQARPAGLNVSRHTSIYLAQLGSLEGATYADLARLLQATPAGLITIASPQVEYDESFFSYAIDSLSSTEGQHKSGVLFGAWIRQHSGRVVDQIFSKRYPMVPLDRLKQVCPTLISEPYRLLSLALFKRDDGLAFLHSLGDTPLASPQALEQIYSWLCHEGFVHSLGHGVVLPQ